MPACRGKVGGRARQLLTVPLNTLQVQRHPLRYQPGPSFTLGMSFSVTSTRTSMAFEVGDAHDFRYRPSGWYPVHARLFQQKEKTQCRGWCFDGSTAQAGGQLLSKEASDDLMEKTVQPPTFCWADLMPASDALRLASRP